MSSREAGIAPGSAGAWDPAFQVFTDEDCRAIREASPLELVDWDAVSRSVMAAEREVLRALCVRTLVLELNCARLLGQLAGDAPEERFADFLARFRDPAGWATLFDEYSVLGRLVGVARRNFRLQVIELLERLSADRAALADHLAIPTGRLVRLTALLSDPHRGGRGVWKLAFHHSRGDTLLMYKPKSLAADARFQGLLERANLAIARGDLDVPGSGRSRSSIAATTAGSSTSRLPRARMLARLIASTAARARCSRSCTSLAEPTSTTRT